MKVALPLAFTAALLLSPSAPAQPLTPNCTGSCIVTITMSAGCGSGIKVAPDPIVVSGDGADITWQIATTGWAFDSNGIFVHQPADAFSKGSHPQGGGKKFGWKNVNKGPRAYKYDINLVDGEKHKCKLDPTIVNQ
jgi:hypothetical protein